MTPPAAEGRAGRYVMQPSGYRAFMPAPLPPNPAIRLEGELQALLSQADRALGRLDGSIQTLPHPDLFVAMYVRKEAVLSSQIEGTQSSLQDVLAAEARVFSPDALNLRHGAGAPVVQENSAFLINRVAMQRYTMPSTRTIHCAAGDGCNPYAKHRVFTLHPRVTGTG